jgi:hypothetical protein
MSAAAFPSALVLALVLVVSCGSSHAVANDGGRDGAPGDTIVPDAPPLPAGWSLVSNPDTHALRSVWAETGGAWAVGDQSTILEGHGASWVPQPVLDSTLDLHGVWGAAANDVWAVGTRGTTGRIAHYDGTGWTLLPDSFGTGLNSVAGTSSTNVWAVGDGTSSFHWNGSAWQSVDASVAAPHALVAVTAAANRAFAATDSTLVIAWDGTSWKPYAEPNAPAVLSGVWGETDLWSTGLGGGVWNTTGVQWNTVLNPMMSNPMTGVWGTGANNVWAVGFYGNIGHWNGSSFALVPDVTHLTGQNLFAVWGTGSGEIWSVGEGGIIIHGSP